VQKARNSCSSCPLPAMTTVNGKFPSVFSRRTAPSKSAARLPGMNFAAYNTIGRSKGKLYRFRTVLFSSVLKFAEVIKRFVIYAIRY
jgi:hypothetical protein